MLTNFPSKFALRITLAAALVAAGSLAQALPDPEFIPAYTLFTQASGGEEGAIDKAAESFEALLKA